MPAFFLVLALLTCSLFFTVFAFKELVLLVFIQFYREHSFHTCKTVCSQRYDLS